MEMVEDIVIVGAGIAGLATALGLQRLGIRSVVLESSEEMRTTGFAIMIWTNAWKALDAFGVGDSLRQQHAHLQGMVTISTISGLPTAELSFETHGTQGEHELRCVKRKLLLQALEKELPTGTVKYSSKVSSIEDSGHYKLVHLADGSTLKTKVLIGCDGVNSAVAKWLGFKKPNFVGRSAIRGYANFEGGHGLKHEMVQLFGEGVRSGFIPCDDTTVYWFFTFTSSKHSVEENPTKMKEFVQSKLGKAPEKLKQVIEITKLDTITCSPLRVRPPWELWWGDISKGNVCVTGDALHPMTPDIGQGGCAALEDGIVLARCLAFQGATKFTLFEEYETRDDNEEEHKLIETSLKKFAGERRWRGIELVTTAFLVGVMQQSDGKVKNFFRDKVLASFLAGMLLKRADFDCGKLNES